MSPPRSSSSPPTRFPATSRAKSSPSPAEWRAGPSTRTEGGRMSKSPAGRKSVNAHTTPFLPYDMEGPAQPDMSWLPLSYDESTGQGTYLMRMEPGAVTIAHDHAGMEEF